MRDSLYVSLCIFIVIVSGCLTTDPREAPSSNDALDPRKASLRAPVLRVTSRAVPAGITVTNHLTWGFTPVPGFPRKAMFVVEKSFSLAAPMWTEVCRTNQSPVKVVDNTPNTFYRVASYYE